MNSILRLRVYLTKLAAGALMVALGVAVAMAADVRAFVAGNFFLNLDGVKAGFLKSVEGGSVTADVIEEVSGPTFFVKKHIGTPKYEDITLQLSFSHSKAVYDWIAASWKMNFTRKNGSIIAVNQNFEAVSERQFFNALITETGIPACDGSSKEPAYITLKLTPELTRLLKAGGSIKADIKMTSQVRWLPSNFRLVIDGLDTSRVSKIDAFTVKQHVKKDDIGDSRDYLKEPGKLEFPNLKITFSQSTAQSWMDWHEDFVIKGNNSDDREKGGTLEFLSPNRQTVLFRIHFFNLGIFKIGPAKPSDESDHDFIGKMQAELYVERMEFEPVSIGQ